MIEQIYLFIYFFYMKIMKLISLLTVYEFFTLLLQLWCPLADIWLQHPQLVQLIKIKACLG